MNNPENPRIMSDVLKAHYDEVAKDVIVKVLIPLGIINEIDEAKRECMENKISGFSIFIVVEKPDFFLKPLIIIINPNHETQNREIRVQVLEGDERIKIDETENKEMESMKDDDKVFHIEEHMFIVDLHTKLSELKHKVLAEKYARK